MKKFLCFLVISVVVFGSCQEEESESISPMVDNRIDKNSQLAGLMKNMVLHDGSFDDIVDRGNCFSVRLPYTILLNSIEFVINDIADYQKILSTDLIQIKYPIVITLFDYREETIRNRFQLSALVNQCKVDDDDIECIDFVYPILLSTFDSRSNALKSLQVGHDSEMFKFMSDIDDYTSVSINYPISLLLHNGQHRDAMHNNDLLAAILKVSSACNENDN